MQYFPLFMKLEGKPVLVVGGGEVACRKIEALIKARACITIVSPKLDRYLQTCVEQGQCEWVQDEYRPEYLSPDLLQVWATTNQNQVNHAVHKDAKSLNLIVNVVDDQPYCDFITPSMIVRGDIQIAISSGGASPVLVRNIRQSVEANLAQNTGLLAAFGASKRDDIKRVLPSVDLRRMFWERFFSEPEVLAATQIEQLEQVYQKQLEDGLKKSGSVTLIELPAAVDLISLRTLQALQKAEMVLYPTECDYAFVDIARRDADREPYQTETDIAMRLAELTENNVCIYVYPAVLEQVSKQIPHSRVLYSVTCE
ncbi:precorrin-2 dehydrogenase/sirohydrochlorin ferrochelatase family protein [Vibrio agarivorans]|uniref:precorrin-2 dehydrogenase/sirohydrochlorin ferrochelatase family protein n=1 Tax=Vibrio agarivorans TaxID=153622 RepID=UPI0025B3EBD6|nr:NAD(P)-dependent oxidoreductase [Vibrio agarivorans]MDN3663337.1 NAD(P)-dependent oxidoreductase [Vibrio agarivorans]